jgi:alcohol dehydrogenase-like protein
VNAEFRGFTHAGLCHSDLHVMEGDIEGWLPMVLGHEGSGVVEDVGPGVTRVAPGDHVVCSFIPSCGSCHWCATGQQAICDMGASIMRGHLPGPRWPISGPGGRYGAMCMLGTFSQYGVISQNSAVRIDPDLPLDVAALVGCGVPTGWGSAVNAAQVRPGDGVIVFGVGGRATPTCCRPQRARSDRAPTRLSRPPWWVGAERQAQAARRRPARSRRAAGRVAIAPGHRCPLSAVASRVGAAALVGMAAHTATGFGQSAPRPHWPTVAPAMPSHRPGRRTGQGRRTGAA